MIWLFVLSLFIVFITPPKFRLPVLGSIVLLALAGFWLSQPEKGAEATRGIIPIQQVELANVKLQHSRGVGQELRGKLLNHSSSDTLTGLGIQLIIKDCRGNGGESQMSCTVLEDVKVHIPVFVPPEEAREFDKRLYLRELHPQGHIQWDYSVLYTEARAGEVWGWIHWF